MNVGDLKKYKDGLYSSLCRDITEFEKNFLFISGGLLAFSITFIKDIIKLNEAILLVFLFLSWALIIISIGVMMFSFLSSAKASDDLWKIVDDFLIKESLYAEAEPISIDQAKDIKEQINKTFFPIKKNLRGQRWFAVSCFILGVVFFSAFVAVNLLKEKNQHKAQAIVVGRSQLTSNDTSLLIKLK